jgi:ABC-type nitrate/sulfonate/bicarbonate transport system substrate-binding protein
MDVYGLKGVTILQMGGQPEEAAGLVNGTIDAAVVSPPYNFQLKSQGFNELVTPADLQKGGANFITNGIVAKRSAVEKNPDGLLRLLKSVAQATKVIVTDREFTKKVMNKWMPVKDAVLADRIAAFAAESFAKEPLVPEAAIRDIVKEMVQANLVDAKAAAATPMSAYYDNRYVEELRRSGFFKELWK